MDISDTLIPNSDQLDAEDLAASGPRIFTVERTGKFNAEQPVNVYFAEFPRPWRPGRNMRRVLAHCWGKDSAKWVGHQVELYCDPDVMFGKEKVGGTRISRLSHIDGAKNAPIIVGRGKRGTWPVKPLPQTADTKAPKPESPLLAALNKVPDISTDAERLEFSSLAAGRVIEKPTDITAADTQAIIEAAEQGATLDELRAASGAVGESDA